MEFNRRHLCELGPPSLSTRAEKKTTIPILSNAPGFSAIRVTLTATDLELGIRWLLPGAHQERGMRKLAFACFRRC